MEKELVTLGGDVDIKKIRIKETLDIHIVDMVSEKNIIKRNC